MSLAEKSSDKLDLNAQMRNKLIGIYNGQRKNGCKLYSVLISKTRAIKHKNKVLKCNLFYKADEVH